MRWRRRLLRRQRKAYFLEKTLNIVSSYLSTEKIEEIVGRRKLSGRLLEGERK